MSLAEREAALIEFCESLPKPWRLMSQAEREAWTKACTPISADPLDHARHLPGQFPLMCSFCAAHRKLT